jgi:hypothetical protein
MIRAGLPELGQRVGDLREGQIMRQPSGGRRDVFHPVPPICADTGTMPQPYVTDAEVSSSAPHSLSGTVMKDLHERQQTKQSSCGP